jgi:hypothetical protein
MSKIAKFGRIWSENAENIALQILYTFVLRAEIATIFGPNVVAISARNRAARHGVRKRTIFRNQVISNLISVDF